ncbi:MAG: hypothetical protein ABDK87_08910 [Atribacterota bacterium]
MGCLRVEEVEEQFVVARLVSGATGRKGDIVAYLREEEVPVVKRRFSSIRVPVREY